MSKKIWLLAILIVGGLLLGATAQAASGSNNVDVTSCEQTSTGIRVRKSNGEPYILTNGCRNAGYGLRNYTMTCLSNTQYQVDWEENCTAGADHEAPTTWVYSSKTSYKEGEKVYLTARADDNKKVTKINIYRGTRLIKTCTNASFCGYVDKAKLGDTSYRSKAYDAAGNIGTSEWYKISVSDDRDNVDPTVDISASKTSYTNENVYINVLAWDNVGVNKVEIYRNGTRVKTCSAYDCQYVVNSRGLRDGNYSFYARAYDAVGNIGRSTNVTITVDNYLDRTGPAISMTGDIDETGHYTLQTYIRDSESNLSRVELYIDGSTNASSVWSDDNYNSRELRHTFTGIAYAYGSHKFIVKAKDNKGNWTTSGAFYLTYENVNITPTVEASAHRYDLSSVGQIELTAKATDDKGVLATEIYLGPNNSTSGMFLVKRCDYSNGNRAVTCTISFPSALYHAGYYYAKATDRDGHTTETAVQYYNY